MPSPAVLPLEESSRTAAARPGASADPAPAAAPVGPPAIRPAIRVAGLAKRYPDRAGGAPVRVFREVAFALPPGGATALIGANGAGKSTLMRCLVRLIEPSDGEIELLGEPIVRLSGERLPTGRLRRLRARVGFVFQRHNLVRRLSVLSNVVQGAQGRTPAFGSWRAWHQALAQPALREEAMDCLERVGLADLARRRADALSGGQSQRVAIARMLMQRPALVLADEPVASLDPKAGEAVMALLTGLLREQGITLLFSTHNVQHALTYGSHVLGLSNGGLTLDTPAASLDRAGVLSLYG